MLVRRATPADSSQWAALRQVLWPPEQAGEHEREIAAFFTGALHDVAEVFLACDDSGRAVRLYARGMADAVLEGRSAALQEVVKGADEDEFVEVESEEA